MIARVDEYGRFRSWDITTGVRTKTWTKIERTRHAQINSNRKSVKTSRELGNNKYTLTLPFVIYYKIQVFKINISIISNDD